MPRTRLATRKEYAKKLRDKKQQQILQIVAQTIESVPQYRNMRNRPTPEDKEYVGVVSGLVKQVLDEKYKKAGLSKVVDPPPLTTIKGWFYKGFPPEIVLVLFG